MYKAYLDNAIKKAKYIEDIFIGFYNMSTEDTLFRYYMGEFFFTYINDKFGSIEKILNSNDKNITMNLKEWYGDDVFTNFKKWLENNKNRMCNYGYNLNYS